jgi:plastocyanin
MAGTAAVERERRGRLRTAALGFGLVVMLAGCGGPVAQDPTVIPTDVPPPTATAAAPVATSVVAIRNFAFGPPAITVPVGTKVTWKNDDIEQHTASATDKTFDSDAISNGKSFSFTFSQAGTYKYSCLIHPEMLGQVIVTAK